MWDKIGLSKPCKASLWLEQLREDQPFDILMVVNNNELMPSSIFCNGVCVLYGDISLEKNSFLHSIQVHARAPFSNSSDSMYIIVLSATRTKTCLCMVSAMITKSVLVAMRINSLKYESSSSQTCAFVFCLSECLDRWDRMCMHKNIHTLEYPRMGSLQTSDEPREFFIVPDLAPDAYLQLDHYGFHHPGQV